MSGLTNVCASTACRSRKQRCSGLSALIAPAPARRITPSTAATPARTACWAAPRRPQPALGRGELQLHVPVLGHQLLGRPAAHGARERDELVERPPAHTERPAHDRHVEVGKEREARQRAVVAGRGGDRVDEQLLRHVDARRIPRVEHLDRGPRDEREPPQRRAVGAEQGRVAVHDDGRDLAERRVPHPGVERPAAVCPDRAMRERAAGADERGPARGAVGVGQLLDGAHDRRGISFEAAERAWQPHREQPGRLDPRGEVGEAGCAAARPRRPAR